MTEKEQNCEVCNCPDFEECYASGGCVFPEQVEDWDEEWDDEEEEDDEFYRYEDEEMRERSNDEWWRSIFSMVICAALIGYGFLMGRCY